MTFKKITFDELMEGCNDCDKQSLFMMGEKMLKGCGVPRDPEKAYEYISTSAALGYPRAQTLAGEMLMGFGVRPDYEEAVGWFRMASDNGDARGTWRLATCLMQGKGTEKNEDLAFSLLKQASKRGCAPAQYDLGMRYLERGDYRPAYNVMRKAAEKGLTDAQYELGMMHYEGRGVKRDPENALAWFRSAAAGGHGGAYVMVVTMLRKGEGTERDIPEALDAIEQGIMSGCYTVSRDALDIYLSDPDYKDDTKARMWAHRIVSEGYGPAMDMVAELYSGRTVFDRDLEMRERVVEEGARLNNDECRFMLAKMLGSTGDDADDARACMLYTEAAMHGHTGSMYALYDIYRGTDNDEAGYWLRRCAAAGDEMGMMALADEYERGEIVYRSDNMAVKWYGKALDKGMESARADIERIIETADPFEEPDDCVDMEKRIAIEDGDIEFYEYIGDRYMDEDGDDYDTELAMRWYARGANLGIDSCKDKLGYMLYHGYEGRTDPDAPIGYLTEAAQAGYASSQYLLGLCYLNGRGVDKDTSKARKWLERAAFSGHEDAKMMLEMTHESEDKGVDFFRQYTGMTDVNGAEKTTNLTETTV